MNSLLINTIAYCNEVNKAKEQHKTANKWLENEIFARISEPKRNGEIHAFNAKTFRHGSICVHESIAHRLHNKSKICILTRPMNNVLLFLMSPAHNSSSRCKCDCDIFGSRWLHRDIATWNVFYDMVQHQYNRSEQGDLNFMSRNNEKKSERVSKFLFLFFDRVRVDKNR